MSGVFIQDQIFQTSLKHQTCHNMVKHSLHRFLLFAAIFVSLVVHFITTNSRLTTNDIVILSALFLLILLYVGNKMTIRKRQSGSTRR